MIWADEPTGNLDSQTASEVMDLLGEVHRAGQALILVTHGRGIGAEGERLLLVRDGQITLDGAPCQAPR